MSTEYTISDSDVPLAIPGEIASVRERLIEAIQKLGYKILGEQPIYAKRGKPAPASVTEATTSLLSSIRDQREKEPIHRKDRNTAEIDMDHLM